MAEQLAGLVQQLRRDTALFSRDEAAIKQAIILRVLSSLNWNAFDINEVEPEFSVAGQRVDYALRDRATESPKVFIEVKRGGEDLEKHEEQLLTYSFREGVELAVLTNGSLWWFYVPTQRGDWRQRRFFTVDLLEQDVSEIVERLESFLLKSLVVSGDALENAKNVLKSKLRLQQVTDAIPRAWARIVNEPDELLVDLVAATTEKLCGFKPDTKQVVDFLKTDRIAVTATPQPLPSPATKRRLRAAVRNKDLKFTGCHIESFTFLGKDYRVSTFRDMLVQVCNTLYQRYPADFGRVLDLRGKKRVYFSRDSKGMWEPRKLDNAGLYVETHFSANMTVGLIAKVLQSFGHSLGELKIVTKR